MQRVKKLTAIMGSSMTPSDYCCDALIADQGPHCLHIVKPVLSKHLRESQKVIA